jgi:hypothetical protein
MKTKRQTKTPAAEPLAPATGYPAHGSDLGELLMIAAAVEGHAAAIKTACEHLHVCARKIDALRQRVRDGQAG